MPAAPCANNNSITRLSVILPTYNERENIVPLLKQLLALDGLYQIELVVVDDDSTDGTAELVKEFALRDHRIRLIRRIGRSGLASAIKEGLLDATGNLAVVMDSDGQHEPIAITNAAKKLKESKLDLVAGSRFLGGAQIRGLSPRRTDGSTLANRFARFSLPKTYRHLSDYMSGFLMINLDACLPAVRQVNVNGFKFFYELLAISQGQLLVGEIPLTFQPRRHGNSKLDLSIIWDFLISLIHTLCFRVIPRKAISFALVGATGVVVQLMSTEVLMRLLQLRFEEALPFSVIIAATSNYLINNALTFRYQRLKNWALIKGLLKFLLVASLPVIANVGLATTFYSSIARNAVWAQLSGILVVFVWNYAASSRFVWNTP